MVNSRPVPPSGASLVEVRNRALQATDVSFVITDAAHGGPIMWVNPAFERTTGWTLDEVRGRNPDLLHGPGTDPAASAELGRAVREGRGATVTVLNYRKDGTTFWNQVTITPVRDDAGGIVQWVGVQVDVTEQVRRDDQQRRSIAVERRVRNGLQLVAQVSELLSDVDNPTLLREIARLLCPEVVAWAGFLLDDGGLRAADGIVVHRESGAEQRREAAHRAGREAEPSGPDPVADLLEGRVEGPVEIDPRADALGPATCAVVTQVRSGGTPPYPVLVHAVPGRSRNLGVLVTMPHGPGGAAELDEHDRTVLHLVVRRVGMAADNVRLYAREHRLAETLQRAMLPEQAHVHDLDVWSYYSPSSGHAQVGGDWFDVLQVQEDLVVLVIGDVVGHDVEAAAAMGQLRSVVRAYAYDPADPGDVLDRVDQLVAGMRVPRSASLVLATLERRAERWLLRYSRAGHLPPLVARGREVTRLDGGAGPMVGFGPGDDGRSTATHLLEPGDLLVLYTDGLIERRDRGLREGIAALEAVTRQVGTQDAAGVGEELLLRLADQPEDDVAVVVVRVPDPQADPRSLTSPRRRRWSLPSEPGSIGRARHAVVRTCETWGIPGAQSAELVVSEMVANAVMHGWGHVVLRLFDTGEGLRIEVEDSNPAPPVTTDGHPGRVGGYGMRIVERLGEWGWRPAGSGKLVWARVRPQPISASRDR